MFIQTFIMHKVTSQIKSVSVFIEDILSQESNGYLSNYAYIQDLAYAAPTEFRSSRITINSISFRCFWYCASS